MKLPKRPLILVISGFGALIIIVSLVLWATIIPTFSPQEAESLKAGESFLQIEGIPIRYRVTGSREKPPVLLMHGIASSLVTWNELAPFLSDRYFVIAYDMPGFGLSGRPETFGYKRDDFARIAIKLMEELKLGPSHLIGHSLGGGTALRIATQRPELVRSLTLVASTGYAFKPPLPLRALASSWDFIRPWIHKTFVEGVLASATANRGIIDSDMVRDYFIPIHLPGRFGLKPTIEAESAERTEAERQDIRNLDVPTLVIWGQRDEWVPVKFAEQFSEDINGADVFIEKRAGHMVHEEYPEPIHKKIAGFLESSEKPQPVDTDPDTDNNSDLRESTEAIRDLDPGVEPAPPQNER